MTPSDIVASVVIVNYKVPRLLRECLLSLRASRFDGTMEIIVVDNNSGDDSHAMVESEFPEVIWIGLKSNIGFGKACNVGARRAQGEYVLLVNPDTVVREDTLSTCISFMREHPRIGALGPKILNPDGTLQVSCRRGFPTPMVAFYRMVGLSKLFPRSQRFGRYNLTFMDPDTPSTVDAVSGSFMVLPRSVYTEIGGFDERFFMYGEDLDLCRRVQEHGYEVWYYPKTQIVHFKGKSSSKRPVRSRASFYEAMIIFSHKYRNMRETFLPGWFIYLGILIQATIHIGANLFRALTACFIDLFIINLVLWAGITVRFWLGGRQIPYTGGSSTLVGMVVLHLLMSNAFLLSFWYRGIYVRSRYSIANAFGASLTASVVFMACVYLVPSLAFSRIAFAASSLVISLLLPAWREILPRLVGGIRQLMYATGNVVIIGSDTVARRLIENLEDDRTAQIVGIIWPSENGAPSEFMGYAVLGSMRETPAALASHRVDLLLVATTAPWYSHVIEALGSAHVRNLTVRWVPRELLSATGKQLPETIPLHDFSV